MLNNSSALAMLPTERAWIPADAPRYVGDQGCPNCGAALHMGLEDSFDLDVPRDQLVYRAWCSRGDRATRLLNKDLRHGGALCWWSGWARYTPHLTIIAHGEVRPTTWPDAPPPLRPGELLGRGLLDREASASALMDLHQRVADLERRIQTHLEERLHVSLPDDVLTALRRLRQLAEQAAQRADGGVYERRMAELRAEFNSR